MQDARLYGHGFDPIELIFGLFAIPGGDQMLGFVQKHRTQSLPPKFFLMHITYFWIIRVLGACLASDSLFLDQMFGSDYIDFDMSIKGRFAQEPQLYLIEIGAVEQFFIGVANMSPFHLARVFRQTVGVPPHAYQTRQRLAHARILLAQGFEVGYVAHETGFADQSHFTRQFKWYFLMPPGSYRKTTRVF